jgi:hypothetical protein
MKDVLKGNFKTRNKVEPASQQAASLEERFEKEALKRLGGSIAFVSKKKVVWDAEQSKTPGKKK